MKTHLQNEVITKTVSITAQDDSDLRHITQRIIILSFQIQQK